MRVVLRAVFVGALLLLCVSCEHHSLLYIYTALSKPVAELGMHQFTALGLLDSEVIDSFDSERQEKIPRKSWMSESLSPRYWSRGTESRKNKMEWFKINLEILKQRLNQTEAELHVLQWIHGCEADFLPDQTSPSGKSLFFRRGIDRYGYDGETFLFFDHAHEVWVAASPAAEPTARKWNHIRVLTDYTKGYLEKECLEWMGKFIEFSRNHTAPPEVYVFARSSGLNSSVILTCMATGFDPPDIVLTLRRNGSVLGEGERLVSTGILPNRTGSVLGEGERVGSVLGEGEHVGSVLGEREHLVSTGLRPNGDGTHQRRDSVEILIHDTAEYVCHVLHAATNANISQTWDHVLPEQEDDVGGVTASINETQVSSAQ